MTLAPDRPTTRTVDDLDQPARRWWTRAACRSVDSETFFEPSAEAAAKDICSACPVITDCLLDAVRQPQDVSVRGGRTAKERRAWLREQGIGAVPEIDWAYVRRMIDAGVGWPEIGSLYGVPANTMQKRWTRACQPPKPHQYGPSASEIDTAAARALLAEGLKQTDVAARLGTTHSTLRRALRREEQARRVS